MLVGALAVYPFVGGGVKLMKILKATCFPGCFCYKKNGCQVIQAVTQLDSLVGGHDEVTFKSKVVSTHLWNTPLNLYQNAREGFLS